MEMSGILILAVSLACSVVWYRFRRKCPNCNCWNGLKKTNESFHRSETRYRTETKKTTYRDRHGNITRTKETPERVPYKVNYYNVTYKCSKCSHQLNLIQTSAKYLKEAGGIFFLLILGLGIFSNKNKSNESSNIENSSQQTEITPRSTSTHKKAYRSHENTSDISSEKAVSDMTNDSSNNQSTKEDIVKNTNNNDTTIIVN